MNWHRYLGSLVIAFVLVLIPSGLARAQSSAGFTFGNFSGSITEAGGRATFTVKLNTQPTANVSVALISSEPTEGTVAPAGLTFTSANWNTPQTVTVTGINDDVDDGDIEFTVITQPAISTDRNYAGLNTGDITVVNQDNDTAGFAVTTVAANSTEAGGLAVFKVKLTSRPQRNVNINLSSTKPAEGTVLTPLLVFTSANWNALQTVSIRGVDDASMDGDVAYSIVTAPFISADPAFKGLDPADISVINKDNDVAGVAVSTVSGTLTEAGTQATFLVKLRSQPTADVTVDLTSLDLSEAIVSSPSLVFTAANWNTAQKVTLTGVDDTLVDGNKNVTINAEATSADSNYTIEVAASVTTTNRDNEGIKFSATSYTVNESAGSAPTLQGSAGSAVITVVLTGSPEADFPVTVNYATSNGTADSATDYTSSNGTLTFLAGETSKTFLVPITNDLTAEANETIGLTLSGANNGIITTPSSVVLNIPANDSVVFNPFTYKVNETGTNMSLTVRLNGPSTETVTVDYAAINGTATAGSDFTLPSGTLSFAPNETSKTIVVSIINDTASEPDESFGVRLSNPAKTSLGSATVATVTIATNDPITLAATAYNVHENSGAASVVVQLSGGVPTSPVSVEYATSDISAVAGNDYTLTNGILNFAIGESSKTISIPITEDGSSEGIEKFLVTLSNPTNGVLSSAKIATVSILANDTLTFSSSSYSVGEQTALPNITVKLNVASSQVVTVAYATSNGTATAGEDFTATTGTLTFAAGETAKTFSLPITNDLINEDDETVILTLSSPSNAGIGQAVATLKIVDND